MYACLHPAWPIHKRVLNVAYFGRVSRPEFTDVTEQKAKKGEKE